LKRALLALPIVRSEVQPDLISIYYDTPDLALNRKQLTLWSRKRDEKFVQTVKGQKFRRAGFAGAPRMGRSRREQAIVAQAVIAPPCSILPPDRGRH
jgi:hypothetical protein